MSAGLAAISLAASACVDENGGAGLSERTPQSDVSIELDRERCFPRSPDARPTDAPYVASPTRPEPRIADPGPPINGTADEPRFAILNRTGETVAQLYWMPSGGGDWSADQIGDGAAIASQRFCTARVIKPAAVSDAQCLFDFRAVTASGRPVTVTGVNVCSARRITFE